MKQVILIGDSIRMGYEPTVRAELKDIAEIWTPGEENCEHSRNVLSKLERWVFSQPRVPDLVHINCGLHDLARDRVDTGMGTTRVCSDAYKDNLCEIFTLIRKQTAAKIVFATTTPVNERWHHQRKGFDRLSADVLNYNTLARAVCREMDVPMNDLYEVVMKAGRDELLLPDGVHFNERGSTTLGKTVATVIRSHLRT